MIITNYFKELRFQDGRAKQSWVAPSCGHQTMRDAVEKGSGLLASCDDHPFVRDVYDRKVVGSPFTAGCTGPKSMSVRHKDQMDNFLQSRKQGVGIRRNNL